LRSGLETFRLESTGTGMVAAGFRGAEKRKNSREGLAGQAMPIMHTGRVSGPTARKLPKTKDCMSHRPARQGGRICTTMS
jgi:hypothetical protein